MAYVCGPTNWKRLKICNHSIVRVSVCTLLEYHYLKAFKNFNLYPSSKCHTFLSTFDTEQIKTIGDNGQR